MKDREHWDARWIAAVQLAASWSKDTSTRTGAVIVDRRQCVVSIGWNGLPRGVRDDVPDRITRPDKYLWTEHAERNAIYNAASCGAQTQGCSIYLMWSPCADCARAMIQAGIVEVTCGEKTGVDDFWRRQLEIAMVMLFEAEVVVRTDPRLNVRRAG